MPASSRNAGRASERAATTSTVATTRNWTDTNRNFIPDCNLTNPAAQTVVGGDVCGADANSAFGSQVLNTTYDPATTSGLALSVWHIDVTTKALLENMGGVNDTVARKITFSTPHLSGYAVAF